MLKLRVQKTQVYQTNTEYSHTVNTIMPATVENATEETASIHLTATDNVSLENATPFDRYGKCEYG